MVKVGIDNKHFIVMLKELMASAWEERKVPKEWVNAVLIPMSKKGNLTSCDNWHGVALLEVVGKVVARVVQGRLQRLAEKQLPKSQCGFRKGRRCIDMIFTIRQLLEKAIEHRTKQFLVFVDLKKAYFSAP